MKPVTPKDILAQLKADLIGKDSYRGITLTYAWMANQFGHFSLGFIPTLLVYTLLKRVTTWNTPALWAAVIIASTWFVFELYNFLGPLLLNRKSKSKLVYYPEKRYQFTPSWWNIAFDTATDVAYFCLGAFSAYLFLAFSLTGLIIVGGILILISYPAYFWFVTRIYLQTAQYPIQARLSQWDGLIADEDKKHVLDFLDSQTGAKHLLIYGPKNSGKTSMAVGIATELSNRHQPCMYTTAMKLYCMFFEKEAAAPLWNWRTARVLVIDDINPGDPITDDLVTPGTFLNFLDTLTPPNTHNRELVLKKNIIWVLGNRSGKAAADEWELMLVNIGVSKENILPVRLQK